MSNQRPRGRSQGDRPELSLISADDDGQRRIRVVVVDDHPLLRDAVKFACEDDPTIEIVGDAGTGQAALDLCEELSPDVLVLDLSLPGGIDGFEVARRLRAEGSGTRILVLTGSEEPGALFECRRIGVDAFVEKDTHINDLPETIKAVVRGTWEFTKSQERSANQQLAALLRRVREAARIAQVLTSRELEVLRHIAAGLTTRQMAGRMGLSQRTVESHIAKLYSKLSARTRVQAVLVASRLGLLEPDAAGGMPAEAIAAWREGGA